MHRRITWSLGVLAIGAALANAPEPGRAGAPGAPPPVSLGAARVVDTLIIDLAPGQSAGRAWAGAGLGALPRHLGAPHGAAGAPLRIRVAIQDFARPPSPASSAVAGASPPRAAGVRTRGERLAAAAPPSAAGVTAAATLAFVALRRRM